MKNIRVLLSAFALGAVSASCTDFTKTPDTTRDPNNQSVATRDNLLIGTQQRLTAILTGELARTVDIWMQQFSGTDRQYQSLSNYSYDENTFGFGQFYSTGGLIDLRRMQASADSAGDRRYGGVAKVMEVMLIGTAADIWGDIPYSEALTDVATPKLDKQLDVYAALQLKLDTAITFLASNTARDIGPRGVDLFYGGDVTKWTRLARTLKARYYLHTAEVAGTPAYANALTNAQQGLQSASDTLRTFQSTTANEQNFWYQFAVINREGYISPGKALVDLMVARNDPRLPTYFAPNQAGGYVGAAPAEPFSASLSTLSDVRLNGGAYRQPLVTVAENKLIIAEAAYRTGNVALALSSLNSERADVGLAPVALAGQALLDEIMTEKYIALFQNIEVWSDYRRTCVPRLTPAANRAQIPGRLLYPLSERNANPNIPAPDQQPARNQNDPNACS